MQKLNSLVSQEAGPTVTEYATTLSVITLSCLTAFALLAAASTGALTRVVGYFT
jgi:Flp pilus assembly pilin Flp